MYLLILRFFVFSVTAFLTSAGFLDSTPSPAAPCVDVDGDGYGDPGNALCSNGAETDCDDSDAAVNPAASEVCDGIDNDCDGWQAPNDVDADGDGQPVCGGDCNDGDVTIYSGAPELCDGKDNDCVSGVPGDERDWDGDGSLACDQDCDDWEAEVFGEYVEVCGDGLDNDCDGNTDDAACTCPDYDADGYTKSSCGGLDCDDFDAAVSPDGAEVCDDDTDNDCNGDTDCWDAVCSGVSPCPVCNDADGDGYAPEGGLCGDTDCDDTHATVYPGAPKICDGLDNNCDGYNDFTTDVDADGDGVPWCLGDCDDGDPDRYPGNTEICDGIDNDCVSGVPTDEQDLDGDGSLACDLDCDDSDDEVFGEYVEVCGDGLDNDCDGNTDDASCTCPDWDGDGATKAACGGTDCDDRDDTSYPGAAEVCTDEADNDCNGITDCWDPTCSGVSPCPVCSDADGDGYAPEGGLCGDTDCDDTYDTVYPGAPKLCDAMDNNCDGYQDYATDVDADGDGVALCDGDCDDSEPLANPDLLEDCTDGIDNDCDYQTDASDVYDCGPPTCGRSRTPYGEPHIFTLLNPDGSTHADNSALACEKCHDWSGADASQHLRCQRCHADPADTSDPYNGVLKASYPLDWPYGFGSAQNVITHSSANLGTTYGTWGADCLTCHNPHSQEQDRKYRTDYGQYIPRYMCFTNDATGDDVLTTIRFTAATDEHSFADGAPHDENICETCHTRTNYHNDDGLAPGDWEGGVYVGHHDGEDCMSCHPHSAGFEPQCGGCHDLPPATGAHLVHFGGSSDLAAYGDTTIAADLGVTDAYVFNCGNCHPTDATQHANGVDNAGGGAAEIELYDPDAPTGSLKALNPPTATYTPGGTVFTDDLGVTYTTGTCSDVYCHSVTEVTTTAAVPPPTGKTPPLTYEPPWQDLVQETRVYDTVGWDETLTCGDCHGYPITTADPDVSAGAGDSHAYISDSGQVTGHARNMTFAPLQCAVCHNDTVQDEAAWTRDASFYPDLDDVDIGGAGYHVNGSVDVVFTLDPVVYAESWNGDVSMDLGPATWDEDTATCSDVACHYSQTEVEWGTPYRMRTFNECNVCHQI